MKKVNNKKGFTLAELLVVVGILAILIAIAVPVFSGALTKADETVKASNLRAAKSEAMVLYLQDDETGKVGYKYTVDENSHEITVTKDSTVTTEAATDKFSGTVVIGG